MKKRRFNMAASSYGGVSLGGVVFVVFLILKLTHLINWSWWWVTSPLWICYALLILCFIFLFIISSIIDSREKKNVTKK